MSVLLHSYIVKVWIIHGLLESTLKIEVIKLDSWDSVNV